MKNCHHLQLNPVYNTTWVGVPPQAVQKTACPIASQFVSTHQGPCPCTWLKRSYWRWLHRQSPPPAVEVQSSGVTYRTAAIFSKLYMQIPAFWCTFSLKINFCGSAKYHVSIPWCITCIRLGIIYYWKTTQVASRPGLRDVQQRGHIYPTKLLPLNWLVVVCWLGYMSPSHEWINKSAIDGSVAVK